MVGVMETNTTTNWEADIVNEAGDDLVTVDLRTLNSKKLRLLRFDAVMAYDTEMIRNIDRLLNFRELVLTFNDHSVVADDGETITAASVSEARQEITDRWNEILGNAEPYSVDDTWDELDLVANGLVMTPGPWWVDTLEEES